SGCCPRRLFRASPAICRNSPDNAVIEFLRPIPSVALSPLVVLILGTGLQSKVFLAVFAAGRFSSPPSTECATGDRSRWRRRAGCGRARTNGCRAPSSRARRGADGRRHARRRRQEGRRHAHRVRPQGGGGRRRPAPERVIALVADGALLAGSSTG